MTVIRDRAFQMSMVKLNHRLEPNSYRTGEYAETSCPRLHKEWLHEDLLEENRHEVIAPELKLSKSLALNFQTPELRQ